MTQHARISNNVHAEYVTHSRVAKHEMYDTYQRTFIAILSWACEIFRISDDQNKRQQTPFNYVCSPTPDKRAMADSFCVSRPHSLGVVCKCKGTTFLFVTQ